MSLPMRTVSFKVPASLDDTLNQLARRRNTTRSALFRQALEALTTVEQGSFTAIADDLVKPSEGPPDLSTNPTYMAGFGE
jgi:predicted transcriptional regulator